MAKMKLSQEEFVARAKAVHGDKYDYSLVNYVNCTTKIKIICPIHGVFELKPYLHLSGQGCRLCGKQKVKNSLLYTTEEFIAKARKVHGDKYDYSLVEYVNNQTPIKIICPKHGVFELKPAAHLFGYGCQQCGKENARLSRTSTLEQFINAARKVHGDKYDYSLVEYINNHTLVKIICPIHGVFKLRPSAHLKGNGCKQCGRKKATKSNTKSLELFIENARKVHGDKYDYSLVNYINNKTKVKIIGNNIEVGTDFLFMLIFI